MWNFILSMLIPMAIRFGVEWVLAKFPGIPDWLKDILRKLENEKQAAAVIEDREIRDSEHRAAQRRAIHQVKMRCSGVACPPDLKQNE